MTTLRSAVLKLAGILLEIAPALKIAPVLGIVLLSAVGAFAQGIPHNISPVLGSNGQPRPGATISFCVHPAIGLPCTNFAQAYNDIALTQLINQTTNPIRTDGLGNVPVFYAAPGVYDYTVSGTGIAAPNCPYVINIPNATNGNNNWTGDNTFKDVISGSANPALTGFTRAASGDQRCWRNNANTADLCLSKNAADQLVASAFSGLIGTLISPSAGTVAASGTVRMPAGDAGICWRNAGNTFDVCLLRVPGDSLQSATGFQGSLFYGLNTGSLGNGQAVSGLYRMADNDKICWRNQGGTADFCLSHTSADLLLYNSIALVDVSSAQTVSGKTVACASNTLTGVACVVASADVTGLNANKASTTLTTPAANGFYVAYCYTVVTTAAGTSSTLPGCQVNYTDADSGAAPGLVVATTSTVNTVGTTGGTPSSLINFFAKSGAAITYQTFSYASNPAGAMVYAVHIRLLGPF